MKRLLVYFITVCILSASMLGLYTGVNAAEVQVKDFTDLTVTATPSVTPAVTPTATPALTPTAIPAVTPTAIPAVTPTVTPSALPAVTPAVTPTVTPTATAIPTPVPTATPTVTPAATPTAIPTATPTPVATPTSIPSPTSTPVLNSVTPSTVTYDVRKLPAFSVDISTPYNLVDVKNGTTSLISGKDYTVSGSTLSIAQGYFNYYFNKFPNQDLKFVLKFSAGNDVTLTVKPFWEVLAEIAPSELKINKGSIADVPVTMTLNGSTLISVNNGTSALTSNDYTVSGNVVTIKKSYITYYTTKFPTQNLNLIFKFSNGYDKVLSLYIGDSPNTVINPTTVTYTVGSKADVNVNATMNGNFFSSIKNGTSDLVPKVDYTYDPNTNALCIRSNYMAYFFSKFNQDLVLTVNLTGGKPATLTIKPSFAPSIKGVAVTAKAGQKVSYVVKATSIKDLGKFIVDIDYDITKLTAVSVQEGNVKRAGYINYFGDADFSNADTGTVSVLSSDDLPTQSKDGDLFTIVFDVKPGVSGTTDIKLKAEIYDLTTTPITVKVEAGPITITN